MTQFVATVLQSFTGIGFREMSSLYGIYPALDRPLTIGIVTPSIIHL